MCARWGNNNGASCQTRTPAGNEFTLNLCTPIEPFIFLWDHALVKDTRPSPHLDTPHILGVRGRRPGRRHLLLCRECGRGSRPSPPRCSSSSFETLFARVFYESFLNAEYKYNRESRN